MNLFGRDPVDYAGLLESDSDTMAHLTRLQDAGFVCVEEGPTMEVLRGFGALYARSTTDGVFWSWARNSANGRFLYWYHSMDVGLARQIAANTEILTTQIEVRGYDYPQEERRKQAKKKLAALAFFRELVAKYGNDLRAYDALEALYRFGADASQLLSALHTM